MLPGSELLGWVMRIETLDIQALKDASLSLYEKVLAANYVPTHIVAIANGGVFVARPIVEKVGPHITYIEISLQRSSTARKAIPFVRKFLKVSPYWITNQLRRIEAWWLARSTEREQNIEELPDFCANALAEISKESSTHVLVVDDAVDSGATLARVLAGLKPVSDAGV